RDPAPRSRSRDQEACTPPCGSSLRRGERGTRRCGNRRASILPRGDASWQGAAPQRRHEGSARRAVGGPVHNGAMAMTRQALPSSFSPATARWFEESFDAPTPAQAAAWEAIDRGDDTLVVAPTGSGKTLAAFLTAIDRLASGPAPADRPSGPGRAAAGPGRGGERGGGAGRGRRSTSVLYISPLKALGVDVERNLTSPLVGTARTAESLGEVRRPLSVGVRTGDTPAAERRRLVTHPPDILITTPESLFLMLTSQARETLR